MDIKSSPLFQKALELGFLTFKQIEDFESKYLELKKLGYSFSREEVLLKLGFLNEEDLKVLKKSLGATSSATYQIIQEAQRVEIPKTHHTPQIPSLPGYRLGKILGKGAMGVVYQGIQEKFERPVAIKFLFSDMNANPSYFLRLEREARALAKLNHPNIVAAFDFGRVGNNYFLVMEFVEGKALDQYVKEGKVFTPQEVIDIGRQVALALCEGENLGLIHRDIKPANLILTPQGVVKVCDYGVAKDIEGSGQSLTLTNSMVGTPMYMSPEQCRGEKKLDIRSDIYSLGASLFHLATGKPPFEGNAPGMIYAQILKGDMPNPKKANPSLPLSLSRLIQKMMSPDPKNRPSSARELVEAFEKEEIRLSKKPSEGIRGQKATQMKGAKKLPSPSVYTGSKKSPAAPIFLLCSIPVIGLFFLFLASSNNPKREKKIGWNQSNNENIIKHTSSVEHGKDNGQGTSTFSHHSGSQISKQEGNGKPSKPQKQNPNSSKPVKPGPSHPPKSHPPKNIPSKKPSSQEIQEKKIQEILNKFKEKVRSLKKERKWKTLFVLFMALEKRFPSLIKRTEWKDYKNSLETEWIEEQKQFVDEWLQRWKGSAKDFSSSKWEMAKELKTLKWKAIKPYLSLNQQKRLEGLQNKISKICPPKVVKKPSQGDVKTEKKFFENNIRRQVLQMLCNWSPEAAKDKLKTMLKEIPALKKKHDLINELQVVIRDFEKGMNHYKYLAKVIQEKRIPIACNVVLDNGTKLTSKMYLDKI
ncbi:MAG: serine/threonine protein kinase, partial [Planctomycetota bacterium]